MIGIDNTWAGIKVGINGISVLDLIGAHSIDPIKIWHVMVVFNHGRARGLHRGWETGNGGFPAATADGMPPRGLQPSARSGAFLNAVESTTPIKEMIIPSTWRKFGKFK